VFTGQKPSGARPLGTPLYHYTSVETFHKIYEIKKLHATNVGCMNDGSEIRLGLKVLQQLIEDRYGKETGREKDLLESLGQPTNYGIDGRVTGAPGTRLHNVSA
jgi:hypothetical protein